MTKNARLLFVTLTSAIVGTMLVSSCSNNPLSPGVEYAPDMYRGPALEAYGISPIYGDSMASRKPVAGTIPRFNDETLPFYEPYAYPNTNEGYEAAGLGLTNPIPATPENLEKGKKVYTNFCVHCHGELGDGNGVLVQRDKFAGVPSYFGATLKDLPLGKMYHTIYYGKNMMGSHASQINYNERWQVIRWVEKLRADGLGSTAPVDTSAAAASATAATTGNPTVKK